MRSSWAPLVIVLLVAPVDAMGAATGDQLEEGRAVVEEAGDDPDLPRVDLRACLREKGRENKLAAVGQCQELVEKCIRVCMSKYSNTYGGRIGCNSECQSTAD